MKLSVKEFAELTGVSVRTLHYYHEIGLLKPSCVDEWTGYRFYDEKSLERMQEVLFYRELGFPLKTISEILSSPDYDKKEALKQQKQLLLMKKNRLENLIAAVESAERGECIMDVKLFDNSEYENACQKYADEAKEKWGNTSAYRESREKTAGYSSDKWRLVYSGMDNIFEEFANCVKCGAEPSSEKAQTLVKRLQNYITVNFYDCTDGILAGLGQMYVGDQRFKDNIDKHGDGTAEFIAASINCR